MTLEVEGAPTDEVLGIMEALSRSPTVLPDEGRHLPEPGKPAGAGRRLRKLSGSGGPGRHGPDRDALVLRGYRAGYLLRMLEEPGFPVEADASARAVADELAGRGVPRPAPETGIPLLDYQRRGYEWMYMLDRLHMGGVLADDMGLGKTVQVIALLKATRAESRTSLVVAPTSLTYNWLSELNRFAPDLSAAVITGTAAQRERMWSISGSTGTWTWRSPAIR